jgi:hypothetical protein
VSAADGAEFVAARGRGTPVAAVVDAVLTGSTLKLVTLDAARSVLTFALAGAQAPKVSRSSDGTLSGDPHGLEVRTCPCSVGPTEMRSSVPPAQPCAARRG